MDNPTPSNKKEQKKGRPQWEVTAASVDEHFKISVDVTLEKFRLMEEALEWTFPSSLSNVERRYVHQLAQSLGLKSKSSGKEPNRVLKVLKQASTMDVISSFKLTGNAMANISNLLQKHPLTVKERQDLQPRTERAQAHDARSREVPRAVAGRLTTTVAAVPPPKTSNEYLEFTSSLPVQLMRSEIISAINNNKVVLISGETGSGKTTQVPQMILDDCTDQQKPCRIICTQPRRLAAISIAERVATERGEKPGQTVGYQIRLESRVSNKTLLTFCTCGVLLRTLTGHESALNSVTHVIVDELHERDRFSDFLLIVLRDCMVKQRQLRLVLMSASLNTDLFVSYFNSCPLISVPGRLFDVEEFFLEDVLKITNYKTELMTKMAKVAENRLKQKQSLKDWQEKAELQDVGGADVGEFVEEDGDEVVEDVILEEEEVVVEEKENLDDRVIAEMDSFLSRIWLEGDEEAFSKVYHLVASEGVSVDYQHTDTSATALMLAAGRGFVNQVEHLLLLGASVTLQDCNGRTALDWATYFHHQDIAELLEADLAVSESTLAPLETILISEEDQIMLDGYLHSIDQDKVDLSLVIELLTHIHNNMPTGAVLVFLPGYEEITSLRDTIEDDRKAFNKVEVYTLHSTMQSIDQKQVFFPPRKNYRKIILSTNIAETSLTINDVVYVIDSGKVKEKSYDALTSIHMLKAQWISKASSLQRRGRAGRCQEGKCYHLFSRARFASFPEYQTPEILRHPLHEVCIQTKLLAPPSTSIADFLAKAPQPPASLIIRNAVYVLKQMDALDTFEDLTEIGHHLSDLPLEPKFGKMVLYAVVLKCLDPILTIVAALSHKDPFVIPSFAGKRREVQMIRAEFSLRCYSDHMVILRAFHGWLAAKKESRHRKFCFDNYLSPSVLDVIVGIRSQILGQLKSSGFLRSESARDINELNVNSSNWAVIKAALTSGLYPNVAQVNRKKCTLVSLKANKLRPHKSSVLSPNPNSFTFLQSIDQLPTEWLVYEEMSRTHQMAHLKGCTVVTPITIALFGGPARLTFDGCEGKTDEGDDSSEESKGNDKVSDDEDLRDNNMQKISIDEWINFRLDKETAEMTRLLRQKWHAMFLRRMRAPNKGSLSADEQVLKSVVACLTEEEKAAKLAQPQDSRVQLYTPLEENSPSNSRRSSKDESARDTDKNQAAAHDLAAELEQVSLKPASRKTSSDSSSPTEETGPMYPNRFFVMKCQNYKCLDMSIQRKLWATHPLNEKKLTAAFQEGSSVYLIFSVQGSGHFQGVAKMAGNPGNEKIKDFGTGNAFPVTWIKRANMPFGQCHHLINSWNDNKRVQVSRDGQEIEPTVGETLVQLWEKMAPQQYQVRPRGPDYQQPQPQYYWPPPQGYTQMVPSPMYAYPGGQQFVSRQPQFQPMYVGQFMGQQQYMGGPPSMSEQHWQQYPSPRYPGNR